MKRIAALVATVLLVVPGSGAMAPASEGKTFGPAVVFQYLDVHANAGDEFALYCDDSFTGAYGASLFIYREATENRVSLGASWSRQGGFGYISGKVGDLRVDHRIADGEGGRSWGSGGGTRTFWQETDLTVAWAGWGEKTVFNCHAFLNDVEIEIKNGDPDLARALTVTDFSGGAGAEELITGSAGLLQSYSHSAQGRYFAVFDAGVGVSRYEGPGGGSSSSGESLVHMSQGIARWDYFIDATKGDFGPVLYFVELPLG